MQAIPDDLRAAVHDRYRLASRGAEALTGGSASTVWRLDSVPPVVVRVSRHYQLEDLRWSAQVAREFAEVVPEAIRPIIGADGEAAFLWDGRPVTVWPFVDGARLDREDPAQLRRAAQLLARLHRAALDRPGLGVGRVPERDDAEAERRLPDPELDAWIRSWSGREAATEPAGWMHRDFFPGNLICRRGEIVGLIDWDEVEWGPLITELAISVWEFGKSPAGDTLLPGPATDFLTAYRQAGGPAVPSDSLIPLLRVRLRRSLTFWRRVQAAGHTVDDSDLQALTAAFESLRHVRLP